VGVVLNLAVWFAVYTLFARVTEMHTAGIRWLVPDLSSLNIPATVIAAGAFVALFRLHWSVLRTLGVACAAGLLVQILMP
jgi:chromate transporter